jgi:hypothetical protein
MVYFSNVTSDYTVQIMKNKPNKQLRSFFLPIFRKIGHSLPKRQTRSLWGRGNGFVYGFLLVCFFTLQHSHAIAQFMPEDPELKNVMVYEMRQDPARPGVYAEMGRWPWSRLQSYYDIIMQQSILPTALPGQEKLFMNAADRTMIVEKSGLGYELREIILAARQVQIKQYKYVYTDYYDVQHIHGYIQALMDTPLPKESSAYGLVTITSNWIDKGPEGGVSRAFSSVRLIDDLALMLSQTGKLVPDHARSAPPDRQNSAFDYVIKIDPVVEKLPYQIMVGPQIVRIVTRTSDQRLYGDRIGIEKITRAEKEFYTREIEVHGLPPRKTY